MAQLYFQDELEPITIEDTKYLLIRAAMMKLAALPLAEHFKLKAEVNRRAINLMCEGMILDCDVNTDAAPDPLSFAYIVYTGKGCYVFDIDGNSHQLIGI